MQKVTIELANCYGIGKLFCEFDFTDGPVHSVYAPNGFMKTSFANALRDLGEGRDSEDRIFPARPTRREVRDEAGTNIGANQVLAIRPYVDTFQQGRASLLLVDAALKQRYDNAVAQIEQEKEALLKALKQRSGVTGKTVTPESELVASFGAVDLLSGLDAMVAAAHGADDSLCTIVYDIVFNEKVVAFLGTDVILKEIAPRVAFEFRDDDGTVASTDHATLLNVLSQGEKRALYLLNVLFEIHIRRKSGIQTLVVVDDIADSFDYRNKYAIIEYLQDVSRTANFKLILLTHNFDFHRAASGRLNVGYDNRRLGVRTPERRVRQPKARRPYGPRGLVGQGELSETQPLDRLAEEAGQPSHVSRVRPVRAQPC